MMRVVLVGCGAMGSIAAERVYLGRDDARIVATVDPDADRARTVADQLDAVACSSLAEALDAVPCDAVDIRTTHPQHSAAALTAIAARKHVLVEKPLATTVADAEAIVAAAHDADVIAAVAENYAFFRPVVEAARLLADGAIGELLTVRTHRITEVTGVWARDGWRSDGGRAGGVLLDQGTHFTQLLRRTVGEITHVAAYTSVRTPGWTADDSAVVNCRFANGLIGQQLYCFASGTAEVGAEAYFYGTEGSLEIHTTYDAPGGGLRLFGRNDSSWPVEGGDYFDSFHLVVEDWLAACRGESAPTMPVEEGLRDLRVVDAALRSVQSRCEVAVEGIRAS